MEWVMPGMTVVLVSVIFVAFTLQRRRLWLHATQSLSANLAACETLVALIANLQQHRGMSSAWLSGDQGFRQRLDDKARQIGELLPALRDLAQREALQAHPCLTPNELQLFRFNWEKLRDGLAGMTPEESISVHSELLEKPLAWLAAVGEARIEPLFVGQLQPQFVRNYAARLPALTECLGQARAVGMGVAANHRCSPVARVRLLFLVSRAESLLNAALADDAQGTRGSATRYAVDRMITAIRRDLLGTTVSLTPEAYFSMASQAIDLIFAWVAESGKQLSFSRQQMLNISAGSGEPVPEK